MSAEWPKVPLGEVLTLYRDYINSPDPRIYPKLSVKLYGKGVVVDTPADGATLKMKRHQLAKAGQVILSEIWGKKGAIGFVPPEGEGALCTSHFFLFDVHTDRIERAYLQAIFTANYLQTQLDLESHGTTGYAAVRPHILLASCIPLPPLPEQQRIVARIEELASKIEEARVLRYQQKKAIDSLCRSMLFGAPSTQQLLRPMRELVTLRSPNISVQADTTYSFAGVYSFGRGVFRGPIKKGNEFSYTSLTSLKAGNFVYPKLMAWEGALAVVPLEYEGLVVSTEFPVFEIDKDQIFPEVLDIYFRIPSVWQQLAGVSTGTNVRRRRLNPQEFLNYCMPVPRRTVQERIREIKRRVDQIASLENDSASLSDKLLPAILGKAFRGEL